MAKVGWMGFSVHSIADTNAALRHIDGLTRETTAVQRRIATGLKVGSARDNGTIWAIAQGMRAANGAREASMQSIDMAMGVVEVALAAATGISDLMVEMKDKLVAATDASLDQPTWRTLMSDYVILGNQINRLAENAEFNDINLLAAGASNLTILVGDDASDTMTINAENLIDGGGIVDVALPGTLPYTDTSHILTQPNQAMVATFEQSMLDVNAALSRLGTGLKTLEIQRELLTKQYDATDRGIGNLVDADLGREGAKLNALFVRQELGIQALEIANRAPGMVLNFFR